MKSVRNINEVLRPDLVKRMIAVVDLTSIVADFQYSVAMQFILTKDVNLFEGKKESYKITEA